jgi:hypothetical protein
VCSTARRAWGGRHADAFNPRAGHQRVGFYDLLRRFKTEIGQMKEITDTDRLDWIIAHHAEIEPLAGWRVCYHWDLKNPNGVITEACSNDMRDRNLRKAIDKGINQGFIETR